MTFLLAAAAILLIGLYLYYLFIQRDIPALVKALRWLIGGGALALAALFALGRRFDIAGFLGIGGAAILLRGKIGPIDFTTTSSGTKSRVNSRYFAMELDHDTGSVAGTVIAGTFAGRDLMDLDENQMRDLLEEVATEPDSVSLLEAWLDTNRTGWRAYFGREEQSDGEAPKAASGAMTTEQAYEILGLSPGAGTDEIKAAHRRLLKAVHPDQGGSTYLAARINAAKDFLLNKR